MTGAAPLNGLRRCLKGEILMKKFILAALLWLALTAAAGAQTVPATGKVTLLDLRSDCIPCDLQDKVVKRVEKKYGDRIAVIYVEAEKDQAAAKKYSVKTLPTLIIYDSKGKVADRRDGGYTKENTIDALIDGLLAQ